MMLWCLPVYAILCAKKGQTERAAELLALAFTHPATMSRLLEQWPMITRLRADLEAGLGTETYAAAWARGQALDLDTVAAALLEAFHEDASDRVH